MPAPADPRPETDTANAPSARSDRDETAAADAARPPGTPAVSGFGPPVESGEVGTLGPYRLVKELGKGGMGAVYATLDTRLERRLALKVMLPQFAADEAAKERFLREARAAAKVKHDNVVTIYEADVRQGVPYIAMEFLEGYPLNEYLKKKGSPTIPQILRIAAETAAGLAAAHKIGLVHRDIKPGNLWLEAPHGRVKVLDFGLAKPVDAEVELTKSGAVVGTPAYMSPEQARGERVDHRTDLFSLGSVLYRLCTGKLPFPGPTTMAVLMALGTEEPTPVREVNPDVPESLAALIHQLLSKRVDDRPQSANEVGKRLRAIEEELTVPHVRAEGSTLPPQVMQPQVVYVTVPVTAAPPEENPFADLDSLDTELDSREQAEPSAPTAEPKPARQKPGSGWLWPAVGFAALAAVVVAGVIVIANKSREPKVESPDGATGTGKDKDGKTLTKAGSGGKQPVPDTSADRKAAEWVLGLGGGVRVNGEGTDRKTVADLPKERFTLTGANLDRRPVSDTGLAQLKELKSLTTLWLDSTQVTDAGLERLKELKSLTELFLSGTQVTDTGLERLKELKSLKRLELYGVPVSDVGMVQLKEIRSLTSLNLTHTKVTDRGLEHLKELKELTHLFLASTQVSDAGLAHLKELKGLMYLDLNGTNVSDAGLEYLKGFKELTFLNVQKTKVTAKGLEALHASLPGCRIEYDGGTIEPIDPDRPAAEYALSLGGTVRVNGEVRDIKAAAELPKVKFTLTAVGLTGKAVTDAGLARFKDCKNLTGLNLVGTQVTDAGLAHLKDGNGLRNLHLHNTPVTDAGLAHLREHKGLSTLDLRGTKVSDAGLEHVKEFKALTWLYLNDTRVGDAGLAHLRELKQLSYLNLHQTEVTDAGLAHLKELKGLTSIELAGTVVTDAGLKHLGECRGLLSVELAGTRVTDAGLEHLKGLQEVSYFGLYGTRVTDAGLAHLKECRLLTALHLGNTAVSDAGLEHLKGLKRLAQLDVQKTKVTAKGLEALRAALPACKIDHDAGVIGPKK